MNIITIFYRRRNPSKFFELMAMVDESPIKQKWENANSTYQIFWEWSQKEDVINLLSFLKETFLDARIAIENDAAEENVVPEAKTVEIQDIQKNDIIKTSDSNECEDEADDDSEEEEIPCEEDVNNFNDYSNEEGSALCELSEKSEEIANEDDNEEVENVEVENVTISAVIEDVADGKDEKISEKISNDTKSVEEPVEVTLINNEEVTSEEIEKVVYNPDEELRRIFTPYFEKYKFNENFCDSAEKFCADQGIKSEAFRRFFALSKSAPNITKLYAGVTRITKQNSALVKIEIKNCFEKFLKSIEPEIFDKCPEITINHFLNLFREENRKF